MTDPTSAPLLVGTLAVQMSSARRWLFLGTGWVGFTLGVVGVLLPVMPAMPFFFLSVWGFSKSSPELERWLLRHPMVGPSLLRFRRYRFVPLSLKVASVGSMVVALGLSFAFMDLPFWAKVTQAALVFLGSVFLLQFPSRLPEGATDSLPASLLRAPVPVAAASAVNSTAAVDDV